MLKAYIPSPLPAQLRLLCAWCGREQSGPRWRAARPVAPSEPVSHGICPDCYESVRLRRAG